jgi:hypothetical protein
MVRKVNLVGVSFPVVANAFENEVNEILLSARHCIGKCPRMGYAEGAFEGIPLVRPGMTHAIRDEVSTL